MRQGRGRRGHVIAFRLCLAERNFSTRSTGLPPHPLATGDAAKHAAATLERSPCSSSRRRRRASARNARRTTAGTSKAACSRRVSHVRRSRCDHSHDADAIPRRSVAGGTRFRGWARPPPSDRGFTVRRERRKDRASEDGMAPEHDLDIETYADACRRMSERRRVSGCRQGEALVGSATRLPDGSTIRREEIYAPNREGWTLLRKRATFEPPSGRARRLARSRPPCRDVRRERRPRRSAGGRRSRSCRGSPRRRSADDPEPSPAAARRRWRP